MKKQPMNVCAGCSVTGDGYGGWCYGGRMNGACFWPEFSGHYMLDPLASVGLYWGLVATFPR